METMKFMGLTLEGKDVGERNEAWRSKKWPYPLLCIGRADDSTWFAIVTFRSGGMHINFGGKPSKRAAVDALKKTILEMQADLAVFRAE